MEKTIQLKDFFSPRFAALRAVMIGHIISLALIIFAVVRS